jgi:cytochrome c biogenesis protein CcdA
MAIGSIVLAFAAGLLSILSPCVLPILPVVLGAAASHHRWGPLALALGLSASFVAVGLFLATIGHSVGLDAERLRRGTAFLMGVMGVVLLLPALQARLALAGAPLGNWADRRFQGARKDGIAGQLLTGVLLGAIWSPCVGPTLGAASLLAAEGRNLGQVGVIMFAFGIGAALPLLALGWLSRETMLRWRNRLMSASGGMKTTLGVVFILLSGFIISGLDKVVETWLVDVSPDWLTSLTTRF